MLPDVNAINIIKTIMLGPPEEYSKIEQILKDNNLLLRTDDGSLTLRSESESELMHSQIGAVRESFEKFAHPSEIAELKEPRILDLCSGLGYNSLAALSQNGESRIDMLEISPEMIFLSRYLNNTLPEKKVLNRAIDSYFLNKRDKQIEILCGDARSVLQKRGHHFYDLVFHDGFSPAIAPQLYTVEFLNLLRKHMNKDSALLSYSSSIPFRSALIEAGFFLGEGPSVGRNRGITIASINKYDSRVKSRLTFSDEKLIALSSIGLPYRDQYMKLTSDEIIGDRNRRRVKYKEKYPEMSSKKIKKNLIDSEYEKIYSQYSNSRESVLAMKEYFLTHNKN